MTSEFALYERLSDLEREWLVQQLQSQRGVRAVTIYQEGPNRVTIEYDAALIHGVLLLEVFRLCGIHARRSVYGANSVVGTPSDKNTDLA